ncbi:hypothetical protein U9M48_019411, partial [Paspalum notatum var. saurae]
MAPPPSPTSSSMAPPSSSRGAAITSRNRFSPGCRSSLLGTSHRVAAPGHHAGALLLPWRCWPPAHGDDHPNRQQPSMASSSHRSTHEPRPMALVSLAPLAPCLLTKPAHRLLNGIPQRQPGHRWLATMGFALCQYAGNYCSPYSKFCSFNCHGHNLTHVGRLMVAASTTNMGRTTSLRLKLFGTVSPLHDLKCSGIESLPATSP